MKVQNLKGTRDFYPEVKATQNFIFDTWKTIADNFNFQDYEGPLLETADLWKIKSGDELPDQMYSFLDKNGKEIAVRPELTPTLARMVAAKQRELLKPIKWYSIGRFWRYERPQSGRLREFFQLNMDILGTESMMADAEVISASIKIMEKFGCTNEEFYIRIGNRKLIQSLLDACQINNQKEVCRLIDKKDKIGQENFDKALVDAGLEDSDIKKLNKILSITDISKIDEDELDDNGKVGLEELKALFGFLKSYGIDEYCELDLNIMRGLDYYTSTVFEVFDRSKKFRAIAGGGRYEDLVSDFGGEKCPGIGYAMGDVVLELFLANVGKLPEIKRTVDYFIAVLSPDVLEVALKIANKLRETSSVDLDMNLKKFDKQMKFASKLGAKKIIFVGPDDVAKGEVNVKDMKTGEEQKKRIDEF